MRKALRLNNPELQSRPKPEAKVHLPLIFSNRASRQEAIFNRIAAIIKKFENKPHNKTQLKISKNEEYKGLESIPYSLFILKDNNANYRYFLTPRRHDGERKLINILGQGGQGVVIPGYEITLNDKEQCSLDPEAAPSVAIKISLPLSEDKVSSKREKIQNELKVAKQCYSDDINVFPEAYERKMEKLVRKGYEIFIANRYKIYTAMDYLPGESAWNFHLNYLKALSNIKAAEISALHKAKYYLELFLESIEYCIKINQQIENAHQKALYLGDVKLPNLILNEDKVTLIDFGMSWTLENLNKCTLPNGTAAYIAPELLELPPLFSTKADDYSKGLVLYCLLGGDITSGSGLKIFDKTVSTRSSLASNGDINEVGNTKKSYPIQQKTLQLSREGPARIKDKVLDEIPILDETKKTLKVALSGLLSVNPDERPEFSDIEVDLISAKNATLKSLADVERQFMAENLKNDYEHIYPKKGGKRVVEMMSKEEKENDQLNFQCWVISQAEFQKIHNKIQDLILSKFCTKLGILPDEDRQKNIKDIQDKVKEENANKEFVTPWQYHRIRKKYNDYKDSAFGGCSWFMQSIASAEAIQAANLANTSKGRYEVIKKYLQMEQRPSCSFFRKPKMNSERAFGQKIGEIRSIMP